MRRPVGEADNRLQVLAVLSTESEHSIESVRSKCKPVVVWEHTYTTCLFFRVTDRIIPQ